MLAALLRLTGALGSTTVLFPTNQLLHFPVTLLPAVLNPKTELRPDSVLVHINALVPALPCCLARSRRPI